MAENSNPTITPEDLKRIKDAAREQGNGLGINEAWEEIATSKRNETIDTAYKLAREHSNNQDPDAETFLMEAAKVTGHQRAPFAIIWAVNDAMGTTFEHHMQTPGEPSHGLSSALSAKTPLQKQ